jgi:hypothetical protein
MDKKDYASLATYCPSIINDYDSIKAVSDNTYLEYTEANAEKTGSLKDGFFSQLKNANPSVAYTYTIEGSTTIQSATLPISQFVESLPSNQKLSSITNLDPNAPNYLFSSIITKLTTQPDSIKENIITKLHEENYHYICMFNKAYSIAINKIEIAKGASAGPAADAATKALTDAGKVSRILLILMLLTNAITMSLGAVINQKSGVIETRNTDINTNISNLIAIQNKLTDSKAVYTTQKELQLYQEQMARKQNFANAGMAIVLLAATIGVILYIGNPIVTGVMTIAIITLALITLIATPVMASIIGLIAAIAIIIVSTSGTSVFGMSS